MFAKKLMKMGLLILFCIGNVSIVAFAENTKIQIPCNQLKVAPYYTQYLVPTPKASSGWKCTAFVEKGTLRDMKAYQWTKKGEPTLLLTGVPMETITPDGKAASVFIDDPKEPQPKLSIRNFINVFSADHKYMTNDEREDLVNRYFGKPKAIFFSRANAIVGIYFNDIPKMNEALPISDARVQHQRFLLFIDRPGHADTYLDVRCDKCFLKDLFPLIVDPVFNAPVPDIP